MNIAIVGANGQVGTELCFLLRQAGVVVVPIVRNRMGAAFLRYHRFPCRIADIGDARDAERALSDADVVVLAAYLWPDMTLSGTLNASMNDRMVEHCVRFSKQDATLFYFSSIRAFSRKVDRSVPLLSLAPLYDKEKRHLERLFHHASRKHRKRSYAFRLGHVFGKHQSLAKSVRSILAHHDTVRVPIDPSLPSNIVHAVTIAHAIMHCHTTSVRPGTYTLVNTPQWTWEDVLRYYNTDGTYVLFEPPLLQHKRTFQFIQRVIPQAMRHYARLRRYLPESVDQHLQYVYRKKNILAEITMLETGVTLRLSGFTYREAPGPFIPGLLETKQLLKTDDIPDAVFSPS